MDAHPSELLLSVDRAGSGSLAARGADQTRPPRCFRRRAAGLFRSRPLERSALQARTLENAESISGRDVKETLMSRRPGRAERVGVAEWRMVPHVFPTMKRASRVRRW